MKLSTAQYLCRRLTYKRGHTLGCTADSEDSGKASITVGLRIPDTTGGPNHPAVTDGVFIGTWVSRPFDLAALRTTEEFMHQLRIALGHFEDHELLENLRYRGEPVWLPHWPGKNGALTKPADDLYFERRRQTSI